VYDFSGNSNFFGRADSMKIKKDETDRINIWVGEQWWHMKELYRFRPKIKW
jgi:hypothetical protein